MELLETNRIKPCDATLEHGIKECQGRNFPNRKIWGSMVAFPVLLGMYWISRQNYLLFHAIAELFSVIVAFGVFVVAWNSRAITRRDYLLFLGIAYLFVAGMDVLHTLAYNGMGVFPGINANVPTQLWVSARYIESISLLLAPFFLSHRLKISWIFAAYTAVFAFLVASIFRWKVFPDCYVVGVGLTPFKTASEYAICLILAISILFLAQRRKQFDPRVFRFLIFAIATAIMSELTFSTYADVYGLLNFAGHFLKIVSFCFVYKAIIETGLFTPYTLMFRDLKQSEEALRSTHDELEQRVWTRTLELSKVNEALRLSEEHFRRTFDQSPVGAAIVSLDYRFQRVNDALCAITGYSKSELSGLTFAEITHPDDLNADFENVERLKAGQIEQYNMEKRYLRKDGRVVWINLHVRMMRDASGTPLYFLPMMEDITERKMAEGELKDTKDFLDKIINSVADPVFVKDSEHRFVLVNDALCDFTALDREQLIGRTDRDFFPEEEAGVFWEKDEGVLTTGEPDINEEVLTGHDGTPRTIVTKKSAFPDTSGKRYIVGIIRDMTERKHMEDELRAYMARLELVNQELEDFAFVASHDLQEPLRKVQTFGDRLKMKYKKSLGPEGQDYLERMVSSANRMSTLLRALLDYSRAATRPNPFSRADLANLVQDAVSDLETTIENHKGVVEVGVLPSAEVDPTQMRQLFQNLIGNALKYCQDCERPVVKIYGEQSNGICHIHVEDNGIGFEEHYLDRIFKPFQRLHGRDEYDGIGMGLAICRKIVERHSGTITARSTPGKGSEFIVSFPERQK